ncbi:MAG: SAF domain-containing protein [Firmicutes bacterium]|nr:SAF domain-containing protein [Bacillota bacterium]
MASNPMQKKTTNAFLLGILVMLIISAIIGVAAYMFIIAPSKAKDTGGGQTALTNVYVAKAPIKSGDVITLGGNVDAAQIQTGITQGLLDVSTLAQDSSARIDLPAGTILTQNMVNTAETPSSDTRLVELNMVTLPTTAMVGTCIDIRMAAPSGQDYIVIAKKNIMTMTGNTIGIYLTDQEMVTMNSAIVDAYIMKASNLYAVQYVEPGMQNSIPTYQVSPQAKALIAGDPNVVQKARDSFTATYSEALRGYINNDREPYSADAQTNLETGVQKQKTDADTARQQYLTGVTPAAQQ